MTPEAQARAARKLLDSLIGRPIREQDDLVLAFARQVRREAFREAVKVVENFFPYGATEAEQACCSRFVDCAARLTQQGESVTTEGGEAS